ncbi:hypothetical protein EV291_1055 [Rhizobium sp. BK068]|nr:hypothetical protein EV291_1055 [Rhizobium sp. BK068]
MNFGVVQMPQRLPRHNRGCGKANAFADCEGGDVVPTGLRATNPASDLSCRALVENRAGFSIDAPQAYVVAPEAANVAQRGIACAFFQ